MQIIIRFFFLPTLTLFVDYMNSRHLIFCPLYEALKESGGISMCKGQVYKRNKPSLINS